MAAQLMPDVDTARRWLREWFWGEVLIAALEARPGDNREQWLAAVNVLRADLERRQADRAPAPATSGPQ